MTITVTIDVAGIHVPCSLTLDVDPSHTMGQAIVQALEHTARQVQDRGLWSDIPAWVCTEPYRPYEKG